MVSLTSWKAPWCHWGCPGSRRKACGADSDWLIIRSRFRATIRIELHLRAMTVWERKLARILLSDWSVGLWHICIKKLKMNKNSVELILILFSRAQSGGLLSLGYPLGIVRVRPSLSLSLSVHWRVSECEFLLKNTLACLNNYRITITLLFYYMLGWATLSFSSLGRSRWDSNIVRLFLKFIILVSLLILQVGI